MESRKAASEEMRLQTTANNRQRGCRRDVRRQTVPNACGDDRKSTIADGRPPRKVTDRRTDGIAISISRDSIAVVTSDKCRPTDIKMRMGGIQLITILWPKYGHREQIANHAVQENVFTARWYAQRGQCCRNGNMSVCLSVCHTPVYCRNG